VSTGAGELRIGEAAARVGVSSRTLRYYEELGLLTPSGRTPGGARRYTNEDIARLEHIRVLQELMGFNLEEILEGLDARRQRYRELQRELDALVPAHNGV
jgi:DNA-binding transcriptional MerR regulator